MNGNAMYEVAKQRIAEQQRAARLAGEARERRAAARGQRAAARERRARKEAIEAVAAPVIPDFAAEMFGPARDAVPAPREDADGGHARTSR